MSLRGKRVAILAEDLYEELELWYPLLRLREEGADVIVVGTGSKEMYAGKHGYPVEAEATVSGLGAEDLDAIIIPGGYAPDRMRRFPALLDLVRQAFEAGRIIAAICHGGWVLVSAGVLSGRKVTGFISIKDDLVNAGARYIDRAVVQDDNLITSRIPDDLPAFCQAIIAALES
jgi:protease I